MNKLLVNCILILLISPAYAQNKPKCQFQRTIGGGKKDNCYHLIETKEKGCLAIGSTESFGSGLSDIYLIKTDSLGNLLWSKTYGGTNNDYGRYMDETKDGNYILLGYSASYCKEYTDLLMLKVNPEGYVLWSKTIGLDKSEYANSIECTKDGGFIILGESINFVGSEKNSNIIVIKTNSKGDLEWTKLYGGNNTDYGYSIQQTLDGGYIVGGETNSFGVGSWEFYLFKLSASGTYEWGKSYGGSAEDYGRYAQQTADGGYIIAGNTLNFNSYNFDIAVIKTDKKGEIIWAKKYGGNDFDYLLTLKVAKDNRYILAGYTNSYGGEVENAFMMSINDVGKPLCGKTFGGNRSDYGVSINFTSSGDILLGGSTFSFSAQNEDVYIIKEALNSKYSCNSEGLYPLGISKIEPSVTAGGFEFDLHAENSPVTVTVLKVLSAEQVLCVEEE